MNTMTQTMRFSQALIQYSFKFGVTKAAIRYKVNHQDVYSRFRYLEYFEEQSSYSSAVFVEHLIKEFPFKIECIQTDNGQEFTNRLRQGFH